MKKKRALLLALCLTGCQPPVTNTSSQGTEIILTNGSVWRHNWNHTDTYIFISNGFGAGVLYTNLHLQ